MDKRSVFLQELGIEEWQPRHPILVELENHPADWMMVSDAFTEPSTQLFNHLLASIGLQNDSQVLIVDAWKYCTPGKNSPQPEAVLPEKMAEARTLLKQQMALTAPKIMMLFGSLAVQLILEKDTPIEQLRGEAHEVRVNESAIPVIATYHPADLLRSPAEKAQVWADLCLARQTFESLQHA